MEQLEQAIQEAIQDGYTTFLSGMAKGVDIWAAELVLKQKALRPELRQVCVIPFPGFGLHWKKDGWTERFQAILQAADAVEYVCPSFARFAYQRHNEYMVDHISRMIAAYAGFPGGTKNTIAYAQKQEGFAIRYLNLSSALSIQNGN